MAPIPSTIEPAFNVRSILDPAVKEISTLLHRLGIVHDHPDFGDGDIPGEGGPGGGIGDGGLIGEPTDAQRSGILMVLMMFGIMAVMFTIVTGWIWCVAAREPAYYTVRESRKGQSKTKKVPFKEWYRNHRSLPRNKSDLSREEDYLRVLAFLSARDWRGCVLPNGEPVDYSHENWEKFWREHGHKGFTAASGPRSPLMMSERGRVYNTFSKEGETGMEIPHVNDIEGVLYATAPHSPLAIPVPPLRRPPSKSTKGRTASSSTSPEDEKRRHREQRSHSSGGGSGGRPWKCGRRDPSDLSDSRGRPGMAGSGRGSSRNYRSSRGRVGMGYKGLDVVEEEEVFLATEK